MVVNSNTLMNWNQFQNILSNLSFGFLLFASVTYWINLFFFDFFKIGQVLKIGRISAICSNLLLIFVLGSRWIVSGYFPLSNLYESLLFLTWFLLAVYFYVELQTTSRLVGALLIPISLLINGFANLSLPTEMQKASPLVPALQSNWLMLHVTMMLFSYALLITGSLFCILFLITSSFKEINFKTLIDNDFVEDSPLPVLQLLFSQFMIQNLSVSDSISDYSKLKLLYLGQFSRFKLLKSLDNWSYRIIGLGFPSITIGIIAGGVWANEAWGSYWSWDPKETWAFITWSVFASYIHARYVNGWYGLKTAILGSLGFFIIWVCYLGVNFLGKGLHTYGWIT